MFSLLSFTDEKAVSQAGKACVDDEPARTPETVFHQPGTKLQHYYFSGGYALAIFAQQTTIMKNLILCFVLLLSYNLVFSQSVSGIVRNDRKEPVAGATVRLISRNDSTISQIRVTQQNGQFLFDKIGNGSWDLVVEAAGQMPYRKQIVAEDNMGIRLEDILLKPVAKELDAVLVRSKKPLIEQSIGKTIINVDAMISAPASNVLEVLSRTPGVTVDNNGGITLNGKGGIMVMIDGRQTYMSAQDLASYLKSLPGATLDKIELIDNPSVKYDAAGNAIINLQLKKNRAAGWNGSLSAGYTQGRYGRQNYSGNLNYHYKKLNLFTNLGVNADKSYNDDVFNRNYYEANGAPSSSVDLLNRQFYSGRAIIAMAGMDYQLSAKTSIGMISNINHGKREGEFRYNSTGFTADNQISGKGSGSTITEDERNNIGFNLNMLHKFDQKGRELSADANYMRYRANITQDLQNFETKNNNNTELVSRFSYIVPSDINIYTAKADYSQPLASGNLEAGVKASFVNNDNISDYFSKDGSIPVRNDAMSNHFIYKENINAAYVNTQQRWGRFSIQAGLRAEQTNIRGRQVANSVAADTVFDRNYLNWFPSAAVGYKLDSNGKNQLILLYSRRINRPNYQSLNPFLFYRDNYSYSGGNPMLNPQMQARYELKYQHGQHFWTGLSYNDFSGVILPVTTTQDSLFITRQSNYARGIMALLNIGVSVSPAKWWSMNSTVRLSRLSLRGTADNIKIAPNTNVLRWELNNYFNISKKLSAELNSYYASADMNGQTTTGGMYRISAGVQYKPGGKGSIRLIMDDIFHSWNYRNTSLGVKQADYTQVSRSDTQRFGLAFSYRFGKKSEKAKKTVNEEEMGRAQ